MSSQKSNATAKRFIAAEYNGRRVAVRRNANYDTTLSLVKEVFKSLRSVDVECISISAFVEELGDSLEISKHIWSDLLPELQRITITLDSSSSELDDPDYDVEDTYDQISEDADSEMDSQEVDATEVEDLENDRSPEDRTPERTPEPPAESQYGPCCNHEPVPTNHRRITKPHASSADCAHRLANLPVQTDSRLEEKYRIKVFYFHKDRPNWSSTEIRTAATTTVLNLQEYIALQCPFKGFIVSYHLFGKPFDHLTYVREMESSLGPKKIQVHMDDRDPGPCNIGWDGGVCDVCARS